MKKSPIRTDRVHGNSSVGQAERTLSKIAKLPDDYRVNVVGPTGRKVRRDAKLGKLGR